MRDDLQRLQQAYQTVLEENFLDRINPFKKKPAPQAAPAPTPRQRFFSILDADAKAAGLTQYIEIPGDPAPGTREYSKNGKVVIQINASGTEMSFYDKDGKLETIELSYSTEDLDRAKAIMSGEKYVDPADHPSNLYPSDPRR